MRVGLDISIQGRQHPTGVERAQATLIDALLSLEHGHELHLLSNGPVPERWRDHPRVVVDASSLTPSWLWRELVVPRVVAAAGLELLHSPVVALSRTALCPQIATVHELPWAVPEGDRGDHSWRHRLALARAVRRAAALLCVSQRTADHLVELHPGCAERITVLPHGVDPRFGHAPDGGRGLLPPSARPPLLLVVGRLRHKKNLARLLDALARLPSAHLLVVGPPGDAGSALQRRAAQPDLLGRVRFPGFLADDELLDAYREARCAVFPSLFEGFGLPVLEAMAAGTPVLAARQGAVREAVGEAALLVDGTSTEELAQGLGRVLDDGALADELAARGVAHAAHRDATSQARKLLSLWEQLV